AKRCRSRYFRYTDARSSPTLARSLDDSPLLASLTARWHGDCPISDGRSFRVITVDVRTTDRTGNRAPTGLYTNARCIMKTQLFCSLLVSSLVASSCLFENANAQVIEERERSASNPGK